MKLIFNLIYSPMLLSFKKISLISAYVLLIFFFFNFVATAEEAPVATVSSTYQNEISASSSPNGVNVNNRGEIRATTSETREVGLGARQEERGVNTQVRQEVRAAAVEERQANQQDKVTERQDLREVRQIALQQIRQERVINLSANISNRMEAAMERMYNIIVRLEQRVLKLKQAGVRTSDAEIKIRESSQLLAEAKVKLNNIDAEVFAATTSNEPQAKWHSVREIYLEVGRLIRASHQALREAISLLKVAVDRSIPLEKAVETNTEAEVPANTNE
jgi:hypothetical protein